MAKERHPLSQYLSSVEQKWKRVFWIAAFIVIGGLCYTGMNKYGGFGGLIPVTNVQLDFEKNIPLVPWAIFIYYSMALYLAIPILVKEYGKLRMVVNGYWFITIISTAFFLFFPTTAPRPSLEQHDGIIWAFFYGIYYYVDGPRNLFPSMHVSSTTFCCLANNRFFSRLKLANFLMAVLINVSTVLVKQHTVLDVVGGTIVGLFAYWVIFGKKWWFTKKWRKLPY